MAKWRFGVFSASQKKNDATRWPISAPSPPGGPVLRRWLAAGMHCLQPQGQCSASAAVWLFIFGRAFIASSFFQGMMVIAAAKRQQQKKRREKKRRSGRPA